MARGHSPPAKLWRRWSKSVLATAKVQGVTDLGSVEKACQAAGLAFSKVSVYSRTQGKMLPGIEVSLGSRYGRVGFCAAKEGGTLEANYDEDYEKEVKAVITQVETWGQYLSDKELLVQQGYQIVEEGLDEYGNPSLTLEVSQSTGVNF